MASVKLEDCSPTLELNVNIKDEEEEEKIGGSVSYGKSRFCLSKFVYWHRAVGWRHLQKLAFYGKSRFHLTKFVVHSNFPLCMKSCSRTVS
jgi:hypothetical protein